MWELLRSSLYRLTCKSCLWWTLKKLECKRVTVMEVSCQTGRQVAATQAWSAPRHATRARRSFQQVMKTGRLASGWQEPGAIRRGKKHKDKMSSGATILDFAGLRQLWTRSVRGADGRLCILHVWRCRESVCLHVSASAPSSSSSILTHA